MISQEEQAAYELLLRAAEHLPFKKLEKLRKITRTQIKERYRKNHKHRKRGNIDPRFSPQEHERFLHFCENPKTALANEIMYWTGTRIGETVTINLNDIDFIKRLWKVHTEKSDTEDVIPLHDEIFYTLREWVNLNHEQIAAHDGYILWSDNPLQQRLHISENWLRNDFRKVANLAGLNQTYGLSTERNGRKPRRLFIKTTHSNRHSYGSTIYELTHDRKAVQIALRHADSKSADTYIHENIDEVHDIIRRAFRKPMLARQPLPPLHCH